MTPERWQRIDILFQEALDRSAAERTAFLDDACAGEEGCREEIQSLISSHERAQDFLEVPALDAAAWWLAEDQADSLVGKLIASYKIEARLGSGGMGEVYLAEDTKLERKVAIKFLPIELEEDDLARRRQIREARAAAKLDHPNICGIHEVASEAGHSFIVMQYVEGETLASKILRRPLGLSESLDVAIQVADALSLAHSRRIVHRDIKPQNIMITPRGQVKVLDFGLAKLVRLDATEQDALYRESRLSETGLIIGTVPYMSPEQAKGEAVDARSDLFSLGTLLYECLTGKSAFAGKTPVEVCAQVIHVDPPPPSQFNQSIPASLDRVIQKALAKDRSLRYQSASELQRDLRTIRDALSTEDVLTIPLALDAGRTGTKSLTALIRVARRPRVLAPAIAIALAALSIQFWWRATPHRPPSEALYWYEQGTSALRDGTYYKASKALERAVQLDDKFALAHARLAEAWSELDYADKANHEILRARSLVNDLSPLPALDALYLRSITHVVLREFSAAIETYQKIAEQSSDVDKPHAYVDLGRAQEKNEEIERAIESYQQAARLAPQDAAAFLRLGILLGMQQNVERAREAFQTAEAQYQTLSNVEGVAEVYYQRGFLFKNLDRLAEARAQLEATLVMTRANLNVYQQVRALQILSSVSAAEGNAAQAEQEAIQAIELARANGIEDQATNCLVWLGSLFLLRGEYGDAEKYYKQALDVAQRNNGRLNEALALFQLGSLREQQRNTDEALRYIEQALPFLQQAGYRKWFSQALTLLGRIQFERGDYEAALRAFEEQLQLGEQVGDTSLVALSHQEIGSVLAAREDYPGALRHFDQNYEINKSLNARLSIGYALTNRSNVLWQIGRYQEARAALDEASSIAGRSEGGYKQWLAEIDMIAGRMELSYWHVQESKVKSREALGLATSQYKDTAIRAKCTLGLAQSRSGAVVAGSLLCKEAIEMAVSTGDPQLLSGALLASAEAMVQSGDAQRALETAQQARESFVRFGQQESEWRAWLIAAQAKRRLGEEPLAREYATTADTRLVDLEQKWGSEVYKGYLARPDIQRSRKQLEQLLNP